MAFNIDDWNDKILRRERKIEREKKKHNFQTLTSVEHDNTFTRDLLILFYASSWQLNMLNYEIWMIAPDLAYFLCLSWEFAVSAHYTSRRKLMTNQK